MSGRRRIRAATAGLVAVAAVIVGWTVSSVDADDSPETVVHRSDAADPGFQTVFESIARQMKLDGRDLIEEIKRRKADATPKSLLEEFEKISNGAVRFQPGTNGLTVVVDRLQLRRNEKDLRSRFRRLFHELYPGAEDAKSIYGIAALDASGAPAPLGAVPRKRPFVLLVHGLDDPGDLWQILAPTLATNGFAVGTLTYPNDQPIAESARFMAAELTRWKRSTGIGVVSIVAHSMGGLVSREFLTNPELYGRASPGGQPYPRVERLIMVGTPNHGSEMAHFRPVAEMRDHMVRAFSGDALLFGSLFDGAGEAQIDLLPGSDFLVALNSRPPPAGVRMTIIAGTVSPVTDDKLAAFANDLATRFDGRYANEVKEMRRSLDDIVDGVGDGVVTRSSSRLRTVPDYVEVRANHLTMLVPQAPGSTVVPPAIPVILERLATPVSDEK